MTFRVYQKPIQLRESRRSKRYLPELGTLLLFYIPGILGFSDEIKPIADILYPLSSNKREIYSFNDKRNELIADDKTDYSEFETAINLSLDEQATLIANEIIAKHPELLEKSSVDVPIVIAAYSYGCSLAAIVANKIVNQHSNALISLYMIDGCTPDVAARFLQCNSKELNQNLIDIINYACVKAGYNKLLAPAKDKNIENTLTETIFEKKLDYLATLAIALNNQNQNKKVHQKFHTFVSMLKNDLAQLRSAPVTEYNIPAEPIRLLVTNKTKENYGTSFLGWPKDKTKLVLQNQLATVAHTDLLSADCSEYIANNLHRLITHVEGQAILNLISPALSELEDSSTEENSFDSNSDYSRSIDDSMSDTTESIPQLNCPTLIDDEFSTLSSSDSTRSSGSSNDVSDCHTPQIDHVQANTGVNSAELVKILLQEQDHRMGDSFKFFSRNASSIATTPDVYSTQRNVP